MKSTGIVRKIDELGRVVIPKEIRQTLRINSGDDMDIFIEDKNIILKKTSSLENINNEVNQMVNSLKEIIDFNLYVTNKEEVITSGELENEPLPIDFIDFLNKRLNYESVHNETKKFGIKEKSGFYFVSPIIKSSDATGLVIVVKNEPINTQDKFFVQVLKKIIENK